VIALLLALLGVVVVGVDAPTVQAAIDQAEAGETVEVPPGRWPGPVVIEKSLILQGTGGIIDGGLSGTVVRVNAPGARLLDVQVKGSGDELQGPDACVWIGPKAVGAAVIGSELTDCLFGIWVHEARGVILQDNVVVGRTDLGHRSNRGNGIHLFDSSELRVVGNTVRGSRDGIYVSATEDSLIEGNQLSDVRYGLHYMYSYDNVIRGNVARRNTAGMALMGSNNLLVVGNIATDNDKHGLLFRDMQYSTIRGNVVEHNGEGLFFFSSLDNVIEGNRIAHNDVGARVWAGTERNVVRGNHFVANRQQVFYVAATDQTWGDAEAGNTWSDYLGWDQDGDGRGDRPYRLDTFVAGLIYRYPAAALLLASPAMEILTQLQSRMPLLRTPAIVEEAPAMVWAPMDEAGLPLLPGEATP
jgi:nitrous oxidase accessory protein